MISQRSKTQFKPCSICGYRICDHRPARPKTPDLWPRERLAIAEPSTRPPAPVSAGQTRLLIGAAAVLLVMLAAEMVRIWFGLEIK